VPQGDGSCCKARTASHECSRILPLCSRPPSWTMINLIAAVQRFVIGTLVGYDLVICLCSRGRGGYAPGHISRASRAKALKELILGRDVCIAHASNKGVRKATSLASHHFHLWCRSDHVEDICSGRVTTWCIWVVASDHMVDICSKQHLKSPHILNT
jgi:hypothetical protein